MDRKLLIALMVGVNRAFPYVNAIASANFAEEIDSLFQVMHRAHHSTSVQALMLLFQVMNSTNSASGNSTLRYMANSYIGKIPATAVSSTKVL
ncbi:CCAAT/enhancer-binding protein zeta [Phytophthora citrophthora]|uniref:CCAAT/enhancer-binding protein zeta n=1 Tax=Phytophthora citrophthora TaxID=4793 RepID=A0AAD9G0R3_9STRA|nr:CCAAT/enhancer-binding protein zeta [Phytophthora citrophthora]